MRILIVGGDSKIGSATGAECQRRGYEVVLTSRHGIPGRLFLDLALPDAWEIPQGPGVALLCAAAANLNACESHPEATRRVNVLHSRLLAERLGQAGYRMIFLSTSLVFDGKQQSPFPGTLPTPKAAYACQKRDMETCLLQRHPDSLVVRLSKVIYPQWPLLRDWAHRLLTGQNIYPFADMHLAPVTLTDTVNLLIRCISGGETGIKHFSSPDQQTYSEAARLLANELSVSQKLVCPVMSPPDLDIRHRPTYVTLGGVEENPPAAATAIVNTIRAFIPQTCGAVPFPLFKETP